MSYVLGIDVGTTFTAASIGRAAGVEVVTLGSANAAMPTVVVLREDGEVLVGEAAIRRSRLEPSRTAREFKRRLGDPAPIIVGGTPFGAEALIGHVLRHVYRHVLAVEGSEPARLVLTHPASWGPYKTELLRQAATMGGLPAIDLVTEPQAAAVHYSTLERIEPGQIVAVYDFGGGTFDAAVVRRTAAGFELIGTPQGIERLGGVDLDAAVVAHVEDVLGNPRASLDEEDSDAQMSYARLLDDCRGAKEALSSDTDTGIAVSLPGRATTVRITRTEFERMIRPRLVDTVEALMRAVRSADLEPAAIDRILLVGGSSRIPLVGQLLAAETGRPVAIDAHPKFAISNGAAIVARTLHDRAVAAVRPAPPAVTSPAAAAEPPLRFPPPGTPARVESPRAAQPPTPTPLPMPPGRPAPPAAAAPLGAPIPPMPPAAPNAAPAGSRGGGSNALMVVIGAAIVALLGIGGFLLLKGGDDSNDAGADVTTTNATTNQSVFDLEVGMCVGDAAADANLTNLPQIGCTQSHYGEVIALFNIADASQTVFPGTEVVQDAASQGCLDRFPDYVGRDYQSSALEVQFLVPTEATWAQGDREVVCIAHRVDGAALTTSVSGSGI